MKKCLKLAGDSVLWRARIFTPKEHIARYQYGVYCRRHNLRFEERAGELILLARLTKKEAEAKATGS